MESPPPGHHNLNSTIAGVLTSTHCSYSNEGCLFQCVPRNAFWFQLISTIHGKLSILGDLQRNVSTPATILPLEMFYAFHHTKPRHFSCATLPGPSIRSVPWLHPRYFRRGPGRPPVRQTSRSPGNHDLHSWYMPRSADRSRLTVPGFPYPENVALASHLESVVRVNGGIPATIGVLNGIAKVGFSAEELIELTASAGKKGTRKLSRRDLGYICGLVLLRCPPAFGSSCARAY